MQQKKRNYFNSHIVYSAWWLNDEHFSVEPQNHPPWNEVQFLFLYRTRGPCPVLALLVNPSLQGLRPLQPIIAKSHLFLANVKQIIIRFVYMRDQEKKWQLQTFIWVLFHYTGPNFAKWTSLWKISS